MNAPDVNRSSPQMKDAKFVPSTVLHRWWLARRGQRQGRPGIKSCDRPGDWHGARYGRRRNPPCHRGRELGVARLAREDGQGTRDDSAQMAGPDDGESGGSRRSHDDGAGQAADRVARRNRVRRFLHRVVFGGSETRLRRHHSGSPGRQAHRRDQAADRRVRRDHAMELSLRP